MACCAFAAFLVGQIYVMVQALSRFMRGGTRAPESVAPAALWRLDAAATPQVAEVAAPAHEVALARLTSTPAYRPKRRRVALLSLAVAAELAILVGGAQWLTDGGAGALMRDAARLASARSFADLALICTTTR